MATQNTEWILRLVDRVTGPMNKIAASVMSTTERTQRLNRSLEATTARADNLQRSFTKFAVGAAAFGALTLGSFQFETAMAKANTMALKGAGDFGELTDQIREISKEVPVARTALADGLYATISAGVPENNWINFLRDSSKAALGGQAETQTVIEATSTVIKNYKLAWEQAGDVQDKFQKTVQLGQIPSLQDLATAMLKPTNLAAELGIGIDELMGSFSTLSGVTGNTNEVGTQMTAILTALLKPTAEATKLANEMGLAFDSASIKRAGGLLPFLNELMPAIKQYASMSGMTEAGIIGQLFGREEAIKPLIALTGALGDSYAKNVTEIANSSGSVKKAFEIMAATSESQLQRMRNNFGNAMDGIISTLGPFINKVLEGASAFFNLVFQFQSANPMLSKFLTYLVFVPALIYGVITGVTILGLRMKALALKTYLAIFAEKGFIASLKTGVMWTWNKVRALGAMGIAFIANNARALLLAGTMTYYSLVTGGATAATAALNAVFLATPIGWIVLGIAAVIAIIVSLVKHWDSVKKAFSEGGFIAGIKRIGFVIIDALLMPVQGLLTLISKIPGLGGVAKGADFIQGLRNGLDDATNVGAGSAQVVKQKNPFENEEFAMNFTMAKTNDEINKTLNSNNDPFKAALGGKGGAGAVGGVSGGSSGSRVLNQTLRIERININVSANELKTKAREHADEVVRYIADALNEGAVQTLNG